MTSSVFLLMEEIWCTGGRLHIDAWQSDWPDAMAHAYSCISWVSRDLKASCVLQHCFALQMESWMQQAGRAGASAANAASRATAPEDALQEATAAAFREATGAGEEIP